MLPNRLKKIVLLFACSFLLWINNVKAQTECNELGVWLWFIEGTIFDSHEALADSLSALGVQRIYVKVADGTVDTEFWPEVIDTNLVNAYKSAGLEVWSWSYNYPFSGPTLQAEALSLSAATGYDGHVVDVEMEFDGDSTQLRTVFQAFKNAKDQAIWDGVTSEEYELRCTTWGNPKDHQFRIDIVDQYVDAHMPQTYVENWGAPFIDDITFWVDSGTAEYVSLGATKPIHHILSNESGVMTATQINEYIQASGAETSIWRIPGGGTPTSIWQTWKQVEWNPGFDCTTVSTDHINSSKINKARIWQDDNLYYFESKNKLFRSIQLFRMDGTFINRVRRRGDRLTMSKNFQSNIVAYNIIFEDNTVQSGLLTNIK